MLFSHGVDRGRGAARCHLGLLGEGSGVSADEASWVVRRLAELLEWSSLKPAAE